MISEASSRNTETICRYEISISNTILCDIYNNEGKSNKKNLFLSTYFSCFLWTHRLSKLASMHTIWGTYKSISTVNFVTSKKVRYGGPGISDYNSLDASVHNQIISWQQYFRTTFFWKMLTNNEKVDMLYVFGEFKKFQNSISLLENFFL